MPTKSPLILLIVLGCAAAVTLPQTALGRGYRRGPSQGQVKAMQAYQKQMQQQFEAAVKREQAEQKAFMDKFDTNHDGKIDGKEKGPAEKFLRERRLGKVGPITGGGGGNVFGGTSGSGSLDPIGAFGAAGKDGAGEKKKK
jgi:hypothetical protein